MRRLMLSLNGIAVLGGVGTFLYLLFRVDVTQSPEYLPWILIGSLGIVFWGLVAYLTYGIRYTLSGGNHSGLLLWRSERQAFILAGLLSLQLALQGFLLWNVFSFSISTMVVIVFEYYFLSREVIKNS